MCSKEKKRGKGTTMKEIHDLVWNSKINVRINVKSNLLIAEATPKDASIHLRIPRDTYLPLYLPWIENHVRDYLKIDFEDSSQFAWFEYENVPLYWNYPVGVLYDSMTGLNPAERNHKDTPISIYSWELELAYGSQFPVGVIPLVGGVDQIKSYWMHQWKQACFVLNGSAKQMMSLSLQDSNKFWESIIRRERDLLDTIVARIIPIKPRHVPLIVHQSLPDMKVMQPVIVPFKSGGSEQRLLDILKPVYPELLENSQNPLLKIVCCGIEIPQDANIYETYLRFYNCDGFLHLSTCLSTESMLNSSSRKVSPSELS